MSEKVHKSNVVSYYDEHAKFKIRDYLNVNPRVHEAWQTLIRNTPFTPNRILEVGCGIGSICAKMNKKWPNATITGMDISTQSIAIATKLFANKNVNFIESQLKEDVFNEKFDLIVFMDVYEHIAVFDRAVVHASLKKLLNNKGIIFLSVPTPHNLKWSLKHKPETMQPVDEHISFEVINKLANDTDTEVQLYQKKSIWNTGDYAHIVLEKNDDFEAAFFVNKPISFFERAKRIFRKTKNQFTKPIRRFRVNKKLNT
ncbi:MAG: class I SAM-dependent methyltransferase [Sphingobacteriales bacterium]|nr:class I SAM-dependent methyltransferase [Sphingobacteriales bacterium]